MNINPLKWFKAALPAVASEPQKVPGDLGSDVAWAYSTIYSTKDFPKYNPDDLVGRKGSSIYKKMMNDEQIKAVVRFKRDAITSRQWAFELDDETLGDTEKETRIKIFEAAIDKMEGSFSDATNNIMSAMYNGFSLSEKVYQLNMIDGKQWYGVKHLRLKPNDTFYFYLDVYGNILRFMQRLFGDEHDLDIGKFIHYVQNPEWDLQYGKSELRECYRAWFSKDLIIKFQNIYLERFAGGFAWVQPVNGKTINPNSQEYADMKLALNNINTLTSMILPANMQLTIEHPGTTDAFDKALAQCDKAIAKALLVPNLLGISEQGSHGSLAQAASQLEAFLWTLEADARRLEDVLNEQLFRELGDLNWGDGLYPCFKFEPISESSKNALINTWSALVTAGAVQPSDTDEDALREMMGMPAKGKVLEAPAPKVPVGPDGQPVKPQLPGLGADGKPVKTKSDIAPGKGDKQMAALEETIVGTAGLTISAFTRATKRVDFSVIANQSDSSSLTTAYDVATINSDAVKRICSTIKDIQLSDVPKLKYTADEMGKMKASVLAGLKDSWKIGIDHASRELRKASRQQKFAIDDLALQDLAAEFLKTKSFTITGNISNATLSRIQNILMEGIKTNSTPADMERAIYNALASDGYLTDEAVAEALGTTSQLQTDARIATIVRTASFEAINEARYNFFTQPDLDGFVEALEYSAILDDRTTIICETLDGDTWAADDEIWATYRPPNHYNCRSLLIPVTKRDTWTASEPPMILPQKGFGFARPRPHDCKHKGETNETTS